MSSYRQMRRHARQARRAGMQPMMVISSGDPFPELAIAAISRWAWHHRSALAPVAVTAGLAVAGAWAHAAFPGWAPAVLAGSPAAASAVLAFGARAGLGPFAERAYAGAVILAGGAWLALAAALGPLAPPLPQALGIGALVLSVPWWAHRRRRGRVRT
jgi:hypothetical protein